MLNSNNTDSRFIILSEATAQLVKQELLDAYNQWHMTYHDNDDEEEDEINALILIEHIAMDLKLDVDDICELIINENG